MKPHRGKNYVKNVPKGKTKRIIIALSGLAAVVVVTVLLLKWYGRTKEIKPDGLFESFEIQGELTVEEKGRIFELLEEMWIEDEECAGFSTFSRITNPMYLYRANALVSMAGLVPAYNLTSLRERYSFLTDIRPEKLGYDDLLAYVHMCRILDIEFDRRRAEDCLSRYYDEGSCLFKAFEVGNLTDSANALLAFGKLDLNRFRIREGIQKAYDSCEFTMDKKKGSLESSGGDVLYCAAVYGMTDLPDWDKLSEWLAYWKAETDLELNAGDIFGGSISARYFSVMSMGRYPGYAEQVSHKCYESLGSEILRHDSEFLHGLVFTLENNNEWENDTVNTLLKALIDRETARRQIDIGMESSADGTALGIRLAEKVGFPLKVEKIRAFIERKYLELEENGELFVSDRAFQLYGVLDLDIAMNGTKIGRSAEFWQKQIDNIIEQGSSETVSLNDLELVAEIVSELSGRGFDVKLSADQMSLIKTVVKKAMKEESIRNSSDIARLAYIDRILSLHIVSEKEVNKAYNLLRCEGGIRSDENSSAAALYPTYEFFCLFAKTGERERMEELRSCAETYYSEGYYCLGGDYLSESYHIGTVVAGYVMRGYVGE